MDEFEETEPELELLEWAGMVSSPVNHIFCMIISKYIG